MGLFGKLWGRSLPASPSPDDLRAMAEMEGRTRPVVMLRPRLAASPLPPGTSKMGGDPDLPPEMDWPHCPACHVPMRFVLQLHRALVPEFPFPDGADQFLLFRCPHEGCDAWRTTRADRHMAWRFVESSRTAPRKHPPLPISRTPPPSEDLIKSRGMFDGPVPECRFDPLRTGDHPGGYEDSTEWWGETFVRFRGRHSSDGPPYFSPVFDEFTERVRPRVGTKVGGFADWQQGAKYPKCRCGRLKRFVFQLSSEDRDPAREGAIKASGERPWPPYWSDHGIMIGDLGNIYFYACDTCGPATLAADWDCG